jgi:hypothetical protein
MKKTINIVRMPNGQYIEKWQYSQGEFSAVGTTDILKATPITFQNFKTFFESQKGTYLTVEITAKIL